MAQIRNGYVLRNARPMEFRRILRRTAFSLYRLVDVLATIALLVLLHMSAFSGFMVVAIVLSIRPQELSLLTSLGLSAAMMVYVYDRRGHQEMRRQLNARLSRHLPSFTMTVQVSW